jgi:hypothetical protein
MSYHIILKSQSLFCKGCGESLPFKSPISIDSFNKKSVDFSNTHKECVFTIVPTKDK